MVSRVLILISLACLAQAWTIKELDDFKGFMKKFGLKYKNETGEFDRRMKVFKDNLKKIKELKNKGYKGNFGINKFAAMTDEEFRRMLVHNDADLKPQANLLKKTKPTHTSRRKQGMPETPRAKRQSIPSSFDYREYGWVTPVKNQGSCGSCWAFTTAAAVETNILAYEGITLDLSEQRLIDCETQSSGCGGGVRYYALQYAQENGLPLESNYPYQTAESGTCSTVSGPYYNSVDYWRLSSESEIAENVYWYGAVTVGFRVPSAFKYYTGGVFDVSSCDNTDGSHAVLIVGYTSDYWIVKNSWGTDWGDEGYVYFKRGKNLCGIADNIVATNIL